MNNYLNSRSNHKSPIKSSLITSIAALKIIISIYIPIMVTSVSYKMKIYGDSFPFFI